MAAGVLAVYLTAINEASVVKNLWMNPWPEFRDFMAHSIYEGESFGGSDIGVTIAILSFFYWLRRRKNSSGVTEPSTPDLKFVWLSALTTSLLGVHTTKWLVSRARPKVFFSHEMFQSVTPEDILTMRWPGFMPFDGPRGLSWNSFPSGHTASCAIMLSISYILFRRSKLKGITSGIIITIFCAAMAVAWRALSGGWANSSRSPMTLVAMIADISTTIDFASIHCL